MQISPSPRILGKHTNCCHRYNSSASRRPQITYPSGESTKVGRSVHKAKSQDGDHDHMFEACSIFHMYHQDDHPFDSLGFLGYSGYPVLTYKSQPFLILKVWSWWEVFFLILTLMDFNFLKGSLPSNMLLLQRTFRKMFLSSKDNFIPHSCPKSFLLERLQPRISIFGENDLKKISLTKTIKTEAQKVYILI